MGKPPSRVAAEAREARRRARALDRKIRELSRQIAHPERHFERVPDKPLLSTDSFRRYFAAGRAEPVERRKPTRAELRKIRNRAILWAVVALIALIWLLGKYSKTLLRIAGG